MESTVIVINDGEEDIEESELNVIISNDIKIEEECDIADVINPERVDLPPCSDSPVVVKRFMEMFVMMVNLC